MNDEYIKVFKIFIKNFQRSNNERGNMHYKGSLRVQKIIFIIIILIYTTYVVVSLFHIRVPGGYSSVFQAEKYFYDASDPWEKESFCFDYDRIKKDSKHVNENIWLQVEGVEAVSIEYVDAFLKSYVHGKIVFEDYEVEIQNLVLLPQCFDQEEYSFLVGKVNSFCDLYWSWLKPILVKKSLLLIIVWSVLVIGFITMLKIKKCLE